MTRTSASALQPEWLVIALCPAIAVSDFAVNAIALGVVAILAGLCSALTASLLNRLPQELRWTLGMLILATLVSGVALAMHAWLHDLYGALGIFLPLLVANLAIQWRAGQFAADSPMTAWLAGLRAGATMAIVLIVIAVARELVGHGSFLHSSASLLPGWTSALDQQLFRADMGFLLAMLPPGAFISFGVLLAVRNWIGQRRRHEQTQDR